MAGSSLTQRIGDRRSHHPAQSAMEYLMTYGWAILIISIVLFSLFQLGVFNSSGSTPTAQPGSCRVAKLYSANGGVQASLLGSCSGLKPQFLTQFNGASSDVSLPSTPLSGTGSFTILAWIKTDSTATQGIVTVGNTACGSGVSLSIDSSGYLEEDPSCSTGPTSTPTTVNNGKYHFVGVVYNGAPSNAIQLYVDGVATSSPASQSLNIQTGLNYIGKDASSNYFNGIITNVQIYNTSLSASEIMTLYQEGLGGAPIPLPGMIGWWPLNGNTNDYSGSGNNGVPTGLSGSGGGGGSSSSVATTIATTTISPTCYLLTLATGSGGASATANPANSVGCSAGYFLSGDTTVLTANPSDGYAFTGWAGTSSNSLNPWTFTMPSNAATETASFASMGCGTLPSSISYLIITCYPANIVNGASSATPTNFQQEFPNTPFSATAGNVVMYNGQSGTLMPCWVESSSVIWCNLGADVIGASSSDVGVYYFGLGAPGTNFFISGNDIGEAPQLSSSYGQYDNGNTVFSGYYDFIGTAAPADWTSAGHDINVAVNNGITVSPWGGSIYAGTYVTSSTYGASGASVVDAYGTITSTWPATSYTLTDMGFGTSSTSTGWVASAGIGSYDNNHPDFITTTSSSGTGTQIGSSYTSGTTAVFSTSLASGTSTLYINYASIATQTTTLPTLPMAMGFWVQSASATTYAINWIRDRAYPPSDVMPTASYAATCYPLALSFGNGGTVASPSPASSPGCSANSYTAGQSITLTATANSGYAFSSWTGTLSSSSNPWTFAMPASAVSEQASFASRIWSLTNSLVVAEYGHSCVTDGSYLYSLGGTYRGGVYNYNAVQSGHILGSGVVSTWQTTNMLINPPSSAEYFLSCVTDNSYIYCMGGWNNGGIRSVESAQILGNGQVSVWTQSTNTLYTPTSEESCTITSSNYIYCMGGGSTAVQYAHILGGGLVSAWQPANSLAVALSLDSCITDNSYIYCMGDWSNGNTVQSAQLLPGGGTYAWQTTNSLAVSAYGLSCITANNNIYCMGSSRYPYTQVEYAQILGNGVTSSWATSSTSLVSSGDDTCCVTTGSYAYCMGAQSPSAAVQDISLSTLVT